MSSSSPPLSSSTPSSPSSSTSPSLTNDTSVEFRNAIPEDVDAAIQLIYSSAPEVFDFVFAVPPIKALDFLRFVFIDGEGELGYRNHIVGIRNGKVVAAGAGWSGKNNLSFTLSAARQIIRFYGLISGLRVTIRGLQTESVIPPPGRNIFNFGHLGIAPECQSQGIGKKLIHYLIEKGKRDGIKIFSLDVSVNNPRAQSLYERIGFEVVKLNSSTLRNNQGFVPSHRTMRMNVNM